MQLVKVVSLALLAYPVLSKPIGKSLQAKRQRPYDISISSGTSFTQNAAASSASMAGWAGCTATYEPEQDTTCGEVASSSQISLPSDQADLPSTSTECRIVLESYGICSALDDDVWTSTLSTNPSSATMTDSITTDSATLFAAGVFSVGGTLASNHDQSISTLTFTTTLSYIQGTGASTRTRSIEVVRTSAVAVAAAAVAATADESSSVWISTSCTAEDGDWSTPTPTPVPVPITIATQGGLADVTTITDVTEDDSTSDILIPSTTEISTSSSFTIVPIISILDSLLFGTETQEVVATPSAFRAQGALSAASTETDTWTAYSSWSAGKVVVTSTVTRGQAAVTTSATPEPQPIDEGTTSTILVSYATAVGNWKRAVTYAVTNYAQAAQGVCGAPAPGPTQPGIIDDCSRWYTAIKFDDCATIARREGLTMEQFQVWNPAVGGPSCDKMLDGYAYCVQSCTYNPLTGSEELPAPGQQPSAGVAGSLATSSMTPDTPTAYAPSSPPGATSALAATTFGTFEAALSLTSTNTSSALLAVSTTPVADVMPQYTSASQSPDVPALIPVSSIPPTPSPDATEAAQVALSSLTSLATVASVASVAPSSYAMSSISTSASIAEIAPTTSSTSISELASYAVPSTSVAASAEVPPTTLSSTSSTESSSSVIAVSSSTTELSSTLTSTSILESTTSAGFTSASPLTIQAYSTSSLSSIASAAVTVASYSASDSAVTAVSSSPLVASVAEVTSSSTLVESSTVLIPSYTPILPTTSALSSSLVASAAVSTRIVSSNTTAVLDPNYAALAASSAFSASAARLAQAATTTAETSTPSVSTITSSTLTTVTLTIVTSTPFTTTTSAFLASLSVDPSSEVETTSTISSTSTSSSTVTSSSTSTGISDVPTPSTAADIYHTYKGNGSEAAGWPSMDKWVNFEQMWASNLANMKSSCSQWGVPDNTDEEIADLKSAIESTANMTSLDRRFLLAIVLQESTGCVRVITTQYSVFNPGLMQSHNGTGSCNTNSAVLGMKGIVGNGAVQTPCPSHQISQMIKDGATGTASGDGLEQVMKKQGHTDVSRWYRTARMYNGGSIDPSGDLDAGCCTLSYASDVANRLTGWVNAPHDFTG